MVIGFDLDRFVSNVNDVEKHPSSLLNSSVENTASWQGNNCFEGIRSPLRFNDCLGEWRCMEFC